MCLPTYTSSVCVILVAVWLSGAAVGNKRLGKGALAWVVVRRRAATSREHCLHAPPRTPPLVQGW